MSETHEEDICIDFRRKAAREGVTPKTIADFQHLVYGHYRHHRRSFPWRDIHDPYAILVSEVMLQQTQVERVRDKFTEFLDVFPDVASLAQAPLQDVLAVWQGLGYNRRALALHHAAQEIMQRFNGIVPTEEPLLRSLPGIGPYTAAAVRVFAFDFPAVVIETNIRTVFIHCFFATSSQVSDADIFPLVEETMDRQHPREWYSALMDMGAMLKQLHVNPSRKSAHYIRQTPFEGSDRQIRGCILKEVLDHPNTTKKTLVDRINGSSQRRVVSILNKLKQEGFVVEENGKLRVP